MSMTGFDPQVVNQAIGGVKNAYSKMAQDLSTDVQNQFVNTMEQVWCSPEGIEFMQNKFQPVMKNLNTSIDQTFESVVNSMNSAGQAWAQTTGGAEYSPQTFESTMQNIDVSGMRNAAPDGTVGIDKELAQQYAQKFQALITQAIDALTEARNSVTNSGFVGGEQEANLNNSLETIKTNMQNSASQLSTEVANYINKTVENYSDTEGKISAAFTL